MLKARWREETRVGRHGCFSRRKPSSPDLVWFACFLRKQTPAASHSLTVTLMARLLISLSPVYRPFLASSTSSVETTVDSPNCVPVETLGDLGPGTPVLLSLLAKPQPHPYVWCPMWAESSARLLGYISFIRLSHHQDCSHASSIPDIRAMGNGTHGHTWAHLLANLFVSILQVLEEMS